MHVARQRYVHTCLCGSAYVANRVRTRPALLRHSAMFACGGLPFAANADASDAGVRGPRRFRAASPSVFLPSMGAGHSRRLRRRLVRFRNVVESDVDMGLRCARSKGRALHVGGPRCASPRTPARVNESLCPRPPARRAWTGVSSLSRVRGGSQVTLSTSMRMWCVRPGGDR